MEDTKKKKAGIGGRILRWKMRLLAKGFRWLFFHVVMPGIFVMTTILVAYFEHDKIIQFYEQSPVLTVETIVLWFVLGVAWLIGENDQYKKISTYLLIGGFAFAGIFHYEQLINNEVMAVVSGAVAMTIIVAWRASAGTTWWRFAQGKMATSDADTGHSTPD